LRQYSRFTAQHTLLMTVNNGYSEYWISRKTYVLICKETAYPWTRLTDRCEIISQVYLKGGWTNVKAENLYAMMVAVKEYGVYK